MAEALTEPELNHPVLTPHLMCNEVLLWHGIPRPKFRLSLKQIPLLFFAMVFLAFFALVLFGSMDEPKPKPDSNTENTSPPQALADSSNATVPKAAPHESIIVRIVMFFWVGGILGWVAYCWFGFPISNHFALSQTVYGITNRRVLAVVGTKKKTVRSHILRNVSEINLETFSDGSGTISFSPPAKWPLSMYRFYSQSGFSIEHVANATNVFQLVSEAATKQVFQPDKS